MWQANYIWKKLVNLEFIKWSMGFIFHNFFDIMWQDMLAFI
jgi:hypothetical protein